MKRKVHSIEWNENGDKQLLEELVPVMLEADEIIAQNGDRFDIPYINTRILANELPCGPIWKTVDTLVIARRRFKFPSNRLDALGHFLLGEGKIHTEFGMWVDIKEDDCPVAMRKMVKYCKKDVVLLQKVYEAIAGFHRPKTHAGVMKGREKWTCSHWAVNLLSVIIHGLLQPVHYNIKCNVKTAISITPLVTSHM